MNYEEIKNQGADQLNNPLTYSESAKDDGKDDSFMKSRQNLNNYDTKELNKSPLVDFSLSQTQLSNHLGLLILFRYDSFERKQTRKITFSRYGRSRLTL